MQLPENWFTNTQQGGAGKSETLLWTGNSNTPCHDLQSVIEDYRFWTYGGRGNALEYWEKLQEKCYREPDIRGQQM